MASTQIFLIIFCITCFETIASLPIQNYNSLPIVPYKERIMADNRDSIYMSQPRNSYPRILPQTDTETHLKPEDKVVQEDKDLLLVPTSESDTIVNAPNGDGNLVKNLVSMEDTEGVGDLMDVAENNIVFRPLFKYQRQSAQRSRYSKSYRGNN